MKKVAYLIMVFVLGFLSIRIYAQQADHLVALYFFDEGTGDDAIDSSWGNIKE